MNKKTLVIGFFVVMATLAGGYHYFYQKPETVVSDQLTALLAHYSPNSQLDQRSKVADCKVNGPLPDHACTPGAIFPDATPSDICVNGYTKTVRNVSAATKKKIYNEYGLAYPQARGAFEADHLIPLELGGSNDIANLFPEAAAPEPGFHEKDLVENYLHNEVCHGLVDLHAAQQQIADDWLAVYKTLTPEQLDQLKNGYVFN